LWSAIHMREQARYSGNSHGYGRGRFGGVR
jgi:hypothetical protein